MGRSFCRVCDNDEVQLDWVRGQLELGGPRLVGICKMVLGRASGMLGDKRFLGVAPWRVCG